MPFTQSHRTLPQAMESNIVLAEEIRARRLGPFFYMLQVHAPSFCMLHGHETCTCPLLAHAPFLHMPPPCACRMDMHPSSTRLTSARSYHLTCTCT